MTNVNKEIELLVLRNYSHDELLGDEDDIVNDTLGYSGLTYICDSIMEISDGAVPIYTNEIWKNASFISEYIEEALSEFGIPEEIELIKILSQGYYCYYSQVLYSNIDEFCFNYIAKAVNEFISTHELAVDIEELETTIDEYLSFIDNNSQYYELEDIIRNVVTTFTELIN